MNHRMVTIEQEIVSFLEEHRNPEIVRKYSRFFTEGFDAYGIEKDLLPSQLKIWTEQYSEELGLDGFLDLGDLLVRSGKYEQVILAILFLESFRDHYTKETFRRVGWWLDAGISNWAQADILCQRIIPPMLTGRVIDISDLEPWREGASKWKRRAVPVSILALKNQTDQYPSFFDCINPLMTDSERVVHQGLGWLLREMWKIDPTPVEAFLISWKETAPRLIFQYATEKMETDERLKFRGSKKGKS